MNIRENKILEMLVERERIEVAKLSEELKVSQVTVRKDLDSLERTGIIRREHGFALLSSKNDIIGRLAYHHDIKQGIAETAALLVRDGETVMIESGSCCAILAQTLSSKKKALTIITNSAFIADNIRKFPGHEIILLGGTYQHDSQATVGPMVRVCAANFYVDKLFIGVDGFSEEIGFTNCDRARAQAVRDMAGQARQVIVLTDSEKFNTVGSVPLNIESKISTVITDNKLSYSTLDCLGRKNINVKFSYNI